MSLHWYKSTSRKPAESLHPPYLFQNKKKIAVCSISDKVNPRDVITELQKQAALPEAEWIAIPTPVLSPEVCQMLRDLDGILLVVKAGAHVGKSLEYTMEMLEQQDCKITASMLWDADETLIRAYYCFQGTREETT